MKPVALLAVAVLMAACHHVPLPTPDTRPDPAAPAGGGTRVACEIVSGSNTGPGPTEGCYDGREKGPVGVPVPARVAAAPAPGAPPPGITPEDCHRTGWGAVARFWTNLDKVESWKAYCESLDRQAAAASAAATPAPLTGSQATAIVGNAGGCPMTAACQQARATQDRKLASLSARMAGLGVGAQYGFAWCGARITQDAARACAASLRAIGQSSCAATAESAAQNAAAKAREAVANGRAVGVDASRLVPCG
jgi:hypothetical protein